MRTIALLLIGAVLGATVTVTAIAVTGGWYEYHIVDRGDGNPVDMVNRDGWELVSYPTTGSGPNLYYLRRPRLRVH